MLDELDPDGNYNTFPFLEVLEGVKLSKKKRLFREFGSVKKPMLVLHASEDEYCYGKIPEIMQILKKYTSRASKATFFVIEGADHSFAGKERELARKVANWLT